MSDRVLFAVCGAIVIVSAIFVPRSWWGGTVAVILHEHDPNYVSIWDTPDAGRTASPCRCADTP